MKDKSVSHYGSQARGKFWFVLGSPLFLFLFFQNCTNENGFNTGAATVNPSGEGLSLDDDNQYTNQQIVKVHIEPDGKDYKTMRISATNDFSQSETVPYATSFLFDLKDQFAPDGSKDGEKVVFVELLPAIGAGTVLQQTIGLDTVFPSVVPKGILASGLQGKSINENSATDLSWDGNDVPAPTGYSSGLDPKKGLKLGYTHKEDCSASQVTLINDWQGFKDSETVSWPQKNPLDTIYFCIYIQDRAGNAKAVLSQPMSALWKVIVGENSQGNGGHFLSPNVRFKSPARIHVDAQGNVFIADEHFHNARVISSPTNTAPGSMSLFMGDGHGFSPGASGQSLEASFRNGFRDMFVDEATNQAYVSHLSGIFRIHLSADRTQGDFERIITGVGARMAERNVNGVKSVLLYHSSNVADGTIGTINTGSYLYEVPWDEFTGITTSWNLDSLAPYKIAGNGSVPLSSFTLPDSVDIGVDLSSDMSQSIGWAGPIIADTDGTIYIATKKDGNNRGWGHHTIRKLTPNNDGTLKSEVIGTAPWARQLALANNKLFIARSTGFNAIDLTTLAYEAPIPISGAKSYEGVFAHKVNGTTVFYVSESYRSQIGVYNQDFELQYRIGRPVYAETEPNTLLAMVGQPDGVVETPSGEIYYVDALNHALRKVDTSGAITTIFGGPEKGKNLVPVNIPLADMTMNGRGATANGYQINLLGHFANGKNILYMGTGSYRTVIGIDLDNNIANTVVRDDFSSVAELSPTGRNLFAVNGFDLDPTTNTLYMGRTYHYGDNQPTHANFTGFISQASILGTNGLSKQSLYAGDLMKNEGDFRNGSGNSTIMAPADELNMYTSRSMKISEDRIMYSGDYGLIAHDLQNETFRAISIDGSSKRRLQQFEVFSEGGDDYIVYRAGERLKYIKLNRQEILTSTSTIDVPSAFLCLPGTFLNNSKYFSKGGDDNLIISDSWNGRILKYFVSSSNGFTFQECQ